MGTTVGQIVTMLELVADDVIRELEDVSEEVLNWPIDVPEANSLFAIATHLMAAGERWTIGAIGGRPRARDRDAEFRATGHLEDLRDRHIAWMTTMHEILDQLPDEELRRSTGVPPYRGDLGVEEMTVAHALAHAVDHTGIHLGHIQVTKQFLLAGKL